MRLYDCRVIVDPPTPEEWLATYHAKGDTVTKAAHDRYKAWYARWVGKEGIIMDRRVSGGSYFFLILFGERLETFEHHMVRLHSDDAADYAKEQADRREERQKYLNR